MPLPFTSTGIENQISALSKSRPGRIALRYCSTPFGITDFRTPGGYRSGIAVRITDENVIARHLNVCGGNDDGAASREIRFAGARHARRNPLSPIPAVNAASMPQRSLSDPRSQDVVDSPHARLAPKPQSGPRLLVEPFASGGLVSLTAVMEGMSERCLMAALDRDAVAFSPPAISAR